MPLMRMLMLNFCHFQIPDLMRAKATEAGPPITLSVFSLGPSLTVVPGLAPDVLGEGQVWAPPITQQLLGHLLVMETSLDYKNGMVLKQVGWSEGDQALLVQCVLQWWLGKSTAGHHPGSLVWHQIGLVCQPNWWCLMAWMCHLMPHPNSVLLLTTATHKSGWPNLGQSLWLLLGQLCHLKPCLPQLMPAMHEMVVVLLSHLWWRSPVFPNNNYSQASQVLVSLPETSMVIMMGCFQMPLDLQGHLSCFMGWGCGPQSGYWVQTCDHLGHSIWQPLTWKQWPWIETLNWFIQFGCKGPCKKIKKLWGLC